jgi:hypothetical protein
LRAKRDLIAGGLGAKRSRGRGGVYGRAVAVDDKPTPDRYCASLREAIGWAPEGDEWHLWYVAIDQVSWFRAVGEGPSRGTRRRCGARPNLAGMGRLDGCPTTSQVPG